MVARTVTVVGAGGIGTYLAAHIKGARVVVRAKRKGSLGAFKLTGSLHAETSPEVVSWEEIQRLDGVALVAVKATQLAEVLEALKPRLSPDARVVFLQNGIGIFEEAASVLPESRMVRGLCWLGVMLERPGEARVTGEVRIDLAGAAAPEIAPLFSWIPVRAVRSVGEAEWHKAFWNIAVNGLCAIADAPNGALLESASLRRLSDRLLAEAREVASLEGYRFGPEVLEEVYASTRATAGNLNSTLQDLRAGRPTEIRWLNGAVSRLGRRHNLATPTNDFVTEMVRFLEERASPG